MGWFGNLFKKKDKEELKTEEVKEQPKPQSEWIQSPVPKEQWVCEGCKGSIDVGERWSKFNGKYYHKQCYKQLKKIAMGGG